MKTQQILPFALFYGLLTTIHIAVSSFEIGQLAYFTKPLLMLVLGVYFYQNTPKPLATLSKITLFALFFSWLGDVFLLFQAYQDIYFLLGLVSFLIAHICYIFAFTQTPKSAKSSIKVVLPAAFGYFLLGASALFFLKEGLGSMFIPVIVYSLTIVLMNIMAVNRYGKVATSSFQWVLFGAIAFLISDSLIAVNKFYTPIAAPSFWIMSTYCLGQFLIVIGILKQLKEQ
ncbi:MAG: lysoplasmalogenase [Chitinophagales bacterium]